LELAEYHQMPYMLMPEFTAELKAEDLYEATDMSAFNAALPAGFDRYTAFLERNGLEHMWREGNGAGDFDERLAAARFPPPVHPLVASDGHEIASRLKWLRDGMVLDITRHPQAYEHPFPHPEWSGAGTRYARLNEHVNTQARQIDELYARLERVERNSPRGLTKRLIRWGKRMVRRRR
ncbi:hypothetical protein, partial [Aeromicrobium sp.]|uniref:hypothetical protein n=1 Tax=Aeromicrobium sp. TaxID=1871063 RepID=UPI002FC69B64